jgi:uncharacterized membrane protein YdcZ (DUF606 family)
MKMYLAQTQRWTVERVIRAMAGVFTLAGAGLAAAVSPWWLLLPGLVGANLVIFSLTGFCPMAVVLVRAGVAER